jgi:hypothetical protein
VRGADALPVGVAKGVVPADHVTVDLATVELCTLLAEKTVADFAPAANISRRVNCVTVNAVVEVLDRHQKFPPN